MRCQHGVEIEEILGLFSLWGRTPPHQEIGFRNFEKSSAFIFKDLEVLGRGS
jgi:hypothetical protein